jgi:predicted ATP-binding protein involved in virulence
MRVKELKLHNFRGIKYLHLVFNPEHNVVVLVGVNGVGKSSILDCINLLMRYYHEIWRKHAAHSYENDENNERKSLLESDVHTDGDRTMNQVIVNMNSYDAESISIEWKIARLKEYDFFGLTDEDYYLEKIYQQSEENITEKRCKPIYNNFFYYLSNREVIDLTGSDTSESKNIVDFKAFSKWFKQTEDLENERRLSDDIEYRHPLLKAVRQAVYSVLGDSYNNLTFKRAIGKIIIKKLDKEIALELLSDGEKNLLAMVGHLSRRLAERDYLGNNLGMSALVLIDEIELHLHPAWQRMIIPRLTKTFPNCQFIVTTHSPQVLSHVDPECIHILDYDGDNVVVKRPDSSYGLDSNRILEDILGVSKRPQEIQDRMLELFRTINNNDLESAKEIAKELGDRIGINEPELVKAEATIKRREIIGR